MYAKGLKAGNFNEAVRFHDKMYEMKDSHPPMIAEADLRTAQEA
ncbi:hypothetical protein [[Clostridium] innocuum]|nr:hypothetical protein [[Clostridium] innocuum]